ncbi:D-aminoacyl-tRNA deacylase [Gracilariopsis chorda]|uniref:D-aminoacyl-tRNA deacylase n=1 Tax=Gracilariopsis chorda TaxID=448386 RepID=A0A2V3IET0_9FLOR|nr:D-aminoacyl-tRNA deacylase [Gracilariopsis chorda]|eukprot:PXF40574.1 D-aminoacyl-tRNA deacylase [Gracilariopsis chorda]
MRLVVQKVSQAAVTSSVEGQPTVTSSIHTGLCVLVGFERTDTESDLHACVKQLLKLRLFSDDTRNTKNSLSVGQAGADLLLVSQFTLNSVLKSGRPSFHRAMPPSDASAMFDRFVQLCKPVEEGGGVVRSGVFGAWMQLQLVNEGPYTVCLTATDGKCQAW